jgi:hypothetical protein
VVSPPTGGSNHVSIIEDMVDSVNRPTVATLIGQLWFGIPDWIKKHRIDRPPDNFTNMEHTMKFFTILIIALCTFSSVCAQDIDLSSKSAKVRIGDVDISITKAPFMQGDWELSMTGTIGKTSSTTISTMDSYGYENKSSKMYGTLSLTAGYYIIDQLSVEPEINYFAYEGAPPGESVLLNLSYTYPIRHSIVALFIRGGYGLGNASSVLGIPDVIIHCSDNFDVKTFNAGAGVKLIIAQNVALRIEMNYRLQTYTQDYSGYSSYSVENKNSAVKLFVGISVLL